MSLVVDALKKLKEEQKNSENKVQAPPQMIPDFTDDDNDNKRPYGRKRNGNGGLITFISIILLIGIGFVIVAVVQKVNKPNELIERATIIAQKEAKPDSGTLKQSEPKKEIAATENNVKTTTPVKENTPKTVAKTDKNNQTDVLFNVQTNKQTIAKTDSSKKEQYTDPLQALIKEENKSQNKQVADKTKKPAQKTEKVTAKAKTQPKPKKVVQKEVKKKTTSNISAKKQAAMPVGIVGISPTQSTKNQGSNADYVSIISQGQSAWEHKSYNNALTFYKKAYDMRHEESVAGNIATLYLVLGDPDNSLKTIKTTSVKSPSIISRLIIEMVNKNYIYNANELLKYARNIKDTGELAYAEGYYYDYTKNQEKALKAFNRAYGLNSKEPLYAYSYARTLDLAGRYSDALEAYRLTLALSPDSQTADNVLNRIQALQSYLGQ